MNSSVVVIESHLLPQRARLRACVLARGRRMCVFTSVRCMDVSCACMSCAYSHERACASTSRVRAGPSCVCVHEHARHLVCM